MDTSLRRLTEDCDSLQVSGSTSAIQLKWYWCLGNRGFRLHWILCHLEVLEFHWLKESRMSIQNVQEWILRCSTTILRLWEEDRLRFVCNSYSDGQQFTTRSRIYTKAAFLLMLCLFLISSISRIYLYHCFLVLCGSPAHGAASYQV